MYILDKERISKILVAEKLNSSQIHYMLDNYPPIDDTLGVIIEQWLNNKEIPSFEIEGISLKNVMAMRHSHFLVAIRDLNKLLDPALTPEKHDQWRRILTTPVYYE